MLVLSRKVGEEVVVRTLSGEIVRLRVCSVTDKGRVRIGFDAARETLIDRGEIYERRISGEAEE